MRKISALLLSLCITACTPLIGYSPKLAVPAKSDAQYQTDLSDCKDQVIWGAAHRAADKEPAGAFGALGGLYTDINTPRQKEPYLQVNDCWKLPQKCFHQY